MDDLAISVLRREHDREHTAGYRWVKAPKLVIELANAPLPVG